MPAPAKSLFSRREIQLVLVAAVAFILVAGLSLVA